MHEEGTGRTLGALHGATVASQPRGVLSRACVASFIQKIANITMVQCCIKGCSSRSDVLTKLHHVHFHRVPKNPEIREKWRQAMNIEKINNSTRICSIHFRKESYYKTTHGLHYLLNDSVPDANMCLVKPDTKDSSDDEEMPQSKSIKQPENKEVQQCPQSDSSVSVPSLQQNLSHPNQSQNEQSNTTEIGLEILTKVNVSGSTIKTGVQIHTHVPKPPVTDPLAAKSQNKVKIKTPLEKRLMKEIKRLQEQSKKRLEAINCLEEQNRRLLTRNSFLEQALAIYEKVPEEVTNAVLQESNFFNT